jgi:hypothetical protein
MADLFVSDEDGNSFAAVGVFVIGVIAQLGLDDVFAVAF